MSSADSVLPQPSLVHAWQALALLKSHLESKAERGTEVAWLSEDARVVLRRFLKAKVASQAGPAAERATAMKQAAEEAKPMASELTMKEELIRLTTEDPSAAAVRLDIPAMPDLDAPQREARLVDLRARAEQSPEARALQTLREKMVFAIGTSMADLVFVGEAPGAQEEELGEPFVGPAGQLLTKMIVAMGLQREGVYISNICKFRPGLPGQRTENRKPSAEEMKACLPYVQEEMEIIKPKVIVALGVTAAEGLLGITGASVGKLRQQTQWWRGVPVVVTYHPSYLLRNESLSEKRKAWEDLLRAMTLLHMPISEKQQGFFLPRPRE